MGACIVCIRRRQSSKVGIAKPDGQFEVARVKPALVTKLTKKMVIEVGRDNGGYQRAQMMSHQDNAESNSEKKIMRDLREKSKVVKSLPRKFLIQEGKEIIPGAIKFNPIDNFHTFAPFYDSRSASNKPSSLNKASIGGSSQEYSRKDIQNKERIYQDHNAYVTPSQTKSPFLIQDSIDSSKYLQSISNLDHRSLPNQMNGRGGYYWNRSVKEIDNQQGDKADPTLKEGQESSVNLSSNNQTSIRLLGDERSGRKSKKRSSNQKRFQELANNDSPKTKKSMFYSAVKTMNRNKTTPVSGVPVVVVEEAVEGSSSKSNKSKTIRVDAGGLHDGFSYDKIANQSKVISNSPKNETSANLRSKSQEGMNKPEMPTAIDQEARRKKLEFINVNKNGSSFYHQNSQNMVISEHDSDDESYASQVAKASEGMNTTGNAALQGTVKRVKTHDERVTPNFGQNLFGESVQPSMITSPNIKVETEIDDDSNGEEAVGDKFFHFIDDEEPTKPVR